MQGYTLEKYNTRRICQAFVGVLEKYAMPDATRVNLVSELAQVVKENEPEPTLKRKDLLEMINQVLNGEIPAND